MGLFIDNSIRFIRKNLDHILLLALGLLIFIVIKYPFNLNLIYEEVEQKQNTREIIIEAMSVKKVEDELKSLEEEIETLLKI